MHNLPAESAPADYAWPTCSACEHKLREHEVTRWACHPCQGRTADRLSELPGLFKRLDSTAALVRGARRGTGMPTGSRVPPIPVSAEVLNLAAVGGVATRLQAIEDAWRQTLGWTVTPWRGNPGQSIPAQITFLINNLGWACERYEEVGQDIKEIQQLHREVETALSPEDRPGRVRIGLCPVVSNSGPCGAKLTASTGSPKVRCPKCLTEWADMGAWRELRKAQEAAQDAARKAAQGGDVGVAA